MAEVVSHRCLAALTDASVWGIVAWTPGVAAAVIWGGLALAALLLGVLWWADRSESMAEIASSARTPPASQDNVLQEADDSFTTAASRDSQLLSFENLVLKEFHSERRIDSALEHLLRRICPDAGSHFAAFLAVDGMRVQVQASRGLSAATIERLSAGRGPWRELSSSLTGCLTGDELRESELYRALSPHEQTACNEIHLVRASLPQRPDCLLMTSMLFDELVPRSQCLSIAEHLVEAAARRIDERQAIESSTAELRLLRSMLELRSKSGGERSAKDALESMLSGLAGLCGFEHGTIFSATQHESGQLRAVFRTTLSSDEAVTDAWIRQEDALARGCLESPAIKTFDAETLSSMAGEGGLTGAAVVPLWRRGKLRGVIAFTRRRANANHPIDRAMLEWSAETLHEALFQTLDRMAIERQALLDALTGIANRLAFNQELDRIFERLRSGTLVRCALVLLDVDRFKSINDRYGHLAGDDALKTVATTIDDCVARTRISDQPLVARFGGEEFAVLLPGVGIDGAERIAESIRVAVREAVVRSGGCEFRSSISAGVACSEAGGTPRGLLHAADQALYQAKEGGRDQVKVACDVGGES